MQVFLIATNLIYYFIYFKTMKVFFSKQVYSDKLAYAIIGVIGITQGLLNSLKIPAVNMISSCMCFYILTRIYKLTINQRLYTITFLICLNSISELISVIIITKISENFQLELAYKSEKTFVPFFIINVFLQCIITFLILLFKRKKFIKMDHQKIETLSILIQMALFLYYVPFILTTILGKKFDKVNLGGLVSFVTLNILFALVNHEIRRTIRTETKHKILEKEMYYKEQQYMSQVKDYNKVRSIKHDMKNHLIGIDCLLESGNVAGARDYIQSLVGTIAEIELVSKTGIVMLDGLFNFKIAQAKESGIKVELNLEISSDYNIDKGFISVVIGNALDNAMEASQELPEEERLIKINMREENENLFLQIKNYFNGELIRDKRGQITSKKRSGRGLINMEQKVKELGGVFKVTYTKNVFTVGVLLYNSL